MRSVRFLIARSSRSLSFWLARLRQLRSRFASFENSGQKPRTLCAAVFRARPAAATAGEEPLPEALAGSEDATASKPLDAPDRELLMAAFTSAAPIAVPALLRTIIRNLPLVLAILSALFVLTRPSEQSAEADAPVS